MYKSAFEASKSRKALRMIHCTPGLNETQRLTARIRVLEQKKNLVKRGSEEWDVIGRELDFVRTLLTLEQLTHSEGAAFEELFHEICDLPGCGLPEKAELFVLVNQDLSNMCNGSAERELRAIRMKVALHLVSFEKTLYPFRESGRLEPRLVAIA